MTTDLPVPQHLGEAGLRPIGQPAEHSPEGPIARGPFWPPEAEHGQAPGIRQMGAPPEHASDTFTVIRSHTQSFQAFDPRADELVDA